MEDKVPVVRQGKRRTVLGASQRKRWGLVARPRVQFFRLAPEEAIKCVRLTQMCDIFGIQR